MWEKEERIMETKRRFAPEQKMQILREHLKNNALISEICEKYSLHPNVYYHWEKLFFERGVEAFKHVYKKPRKTSARERALEEKVKKQQEIISWLTEENIQIKKRANGEI